MLRTYRSAMKATFKLPSALIFCKTIQNNFFQKTDRYNYL